MSSEEERLPQGDNEETESAVAGEISEAETEEAQESLQSTTTTTTMAGNEEEQQQADEAATSQPTMSPEHTLLLQLLRRAKRQQDLITQVQKSLKMMAGIEKSIGKATDQVKQLQSAARETQKQIAQIQRQVAALERAQAKGFQKIAKQKTAPAGKIRKGTAGKGKKNNKTKRKR
ncbi:MAG TPA: hypothetical protein VF172_06165 [Nitrososphaera sp.]